MRDTADTSGLTLEIMDLVGDKWTLLVVHTLGESAMRFSELRRRAAPVSQKMLTQTLRSLERHGMVDRHVLPTAPPQVEYSLTPLGKSFLDTAGIICAWTRDHMIEITEARERFDHHKNVA
jgi:DNA-binding HxlR family transcriptional regulator